MNTGTQAFLSTLVAATATLVALLMAAIAAYFVFLQGKSAEYDDRIDAERRTIQNKIAKLESAWPLTMRMFLPPEFKDRFSAHTGNSRGVQLVEKFAGEINFPSPAVEAALADVADDDAFGEEHWKGRVYALALAEVVNVISSGQRLERSTFALGEPEPRPEPLAAFPGLSSGPGFDQWRNDFDRLSTACRFLELQEHAAVSDFQAFVETRPRLQSFARLYTRGVRTVFDSVNEIRGRCRVIDELSLYQSRYSFGKRVRHGLLAILIVMAMIVGVATPLLWLALSVREPSEFEIIAVLFLSSVLVTASFVVFGWDLFRRLRFDPRLYVSGRWLRPVQEDLERNTAQLQSFSSIQLDRLIDFLGSDSADQISSGLRDKLDEYRSCAEAYNSSFMQLDLKCLLHLQEDAGFAAFRRPYQDSAFVQHASLSPADLADRSKMQQLRPRPSATGKVVLGVESRYSWGSRGRLSLIAEPFESASLVLAIENATNSLASSAEARSFAENRAKLLKLLPTVKERVAMFNRG